MTRTIEDVLREMGDALAEALAASRRFKELVKERDCLLSLQDKKKTSPK